MAKSFFGKLISGAAKAADKSIKASAKERERRAKAAEKERKRLLVEAEKAKVKAEKELFKSVSKPKSANGSISKPKNRIEADDLNKSLKSSDHERMDGLDFVVGFKINRSNNMDSACKICDAGEGAYPKGFKWAGWHEGCKCFMTSILLSDDDFSKIQDMILDGKKVRISKSKTVQDIPMSLKQFVNSNTEYCSNKKWFQANKKYFI